MPTSCPNLTAVSLPQRVSLISQTAASIRAHLRAGHWAERLPAERPLCRHLQVSRPTLRAALRELEREGIIGLTGRTRRLIGPRRGHTPPRSSSRLVTLLAPLPLQSMPPATLFMLDTLRDHLAGVGHAVQFLVDPACFSPKPARALEKLVQNNPATIWVAWGSKEPMQRWFLGRHLPLLVIGSCGPGIPLPSVDVDFRATCRHAGDVLLRRGHTRLALVLQEDAYDGDVESARGFREAVDRHAGAQSRLLRHDGTAAHLCALLDKVLQAPGAPTGYLVVRAAHALTVAMHLMRRQRRLPQDAAVLSRDDEAYLQHTSPSLSRYAINIDQFARKVCNAVCELAATRTLPAHAFRLMPKFIAGETV